MDKIIFIFCNDYRGGAENVMMLVAEEFCKQGKNVEIVSLQYKQTGRLDAFENVRYMPTKNKFIGCLQYLFRYSRAVTDNTFIFSSQIHINGLLSVSKPFFFKKSILILRESTQIFSRFSGFEKMIHTLPYYFYKNANLIIAQTDAMKESIIQNFSKSKLWNLIAIQNPINFDFFLNKKLAFEIEDTYQNAIVTAGRLIPIKAFDKLIQAYSNSAKLQQYKLLIIGDGSEKENLQNIIDTSNLQNKIILLGEISNPFPYFKDAKLCVVSSILEGFPNVILEMMYCCNNVVSTNCAGDLENIKGLTICEPNSNISLQHALENNLLLSDLELKYNRENFDLVLSKRAILNYTNRIFACLP